MLNNSLILALDDQGRETILMGKGIGFHKATGSRLNKEEVEKVFVLKDRNISRNIIRLAADTDAVFFELAKTIIDYGKERFGMEIMDHLYLSLTDHLSYAVQRVKDGIQFQNFISMEMKKFNPHECEVGNYALNLVEERMGVRLPDDEAGNIALHFINAQQDNPYNSRNQMISSVVEDVLNIIQYCLHIVYDREDTSYIRCVTHLRLFAQRLIKGEMMPDERDTYLYQQIMETCARERECVDKIGVYIKERFKVSITNQEELYLTLHIHRVMETIRQKG
uniref:PRD domain-containing protein n=1 Tax=Enterocloster clostridioformis TaxID=1531 RepID=UPI002ECFE4ED